MDQAETRMAVQKMQEYIESHIHEEITLGQLARTAGYSPWHTSRLFKEFTGRAPFDYIRSRRLSQAALVLRDGGGKVLDVALDFVFDSHEGFTRAFSKEFGLPPKRYMKNPPPIRLFMPDMVFDTYRLLKKRGEESMSNEKTTKSVFVQVVERPARKLLLKRGVKAEEYFAYCEEVGCDVWPILTSVKEALYEPVGLWLPKHLIREGTSKYVQGVELPADYQNAVPEGFEIIDLPPCMMMVFQGEPFEDDDFMEAIDEVWAHIEKFNPNIYGYEWAPEAAPRFQMEPWGYRGYIEAYPVVPLKK
jgi:AraC family transcriptional regulator